MKKLIWCTDIHLNFLDEISNKIFLQNVLVKVQNGNAVVVTGDIAEAPSLVGFMTAWKKALEDQGSNLYFVCGNHDFYRGSIANVRDILGNGALKDCWLPSVGIAKLSDTVCLIGHDGWYDGGYDNWYKSKVDMMDYYVISELGPVLALERHEKFAKIQVLAQEAADHVYKTGTEALKTYEHVYIGTHIPPWREAAIHMGKPSDPDWMPHFSSKRMGEAISKLARENPTKKITVLCGHTHSEGLCTPEPNIECYTGIAKYHYPNVNKTFVVK